MVPSLDFTITTNPLSFTRVVPSLVFKRPQKLFLFAMPSQAKTTGLLSAKLSVEVTSLSTTTSFKSETFKRKRTKSGTLHKNQIRKNSSLKTFDFFPLNERIPSLETFDFKATVSSLKLCTKNQLSKLIRRIGWAPKLHSVSIEVLCINLLQPPLCGMSRFQTANTTNFFF